ncbi:glycosyltransferase family 2 protein [Leptospira idonii]|uniref:Glycosyltransferase n=1 Tax=Leptospira idonii TaxID=1193500 RepID=A0A4R9LVS3_9LEPT|nr:glycosyltransferase family 2 protein [Leptospira idonii]TGN18300.1 glycosyltransferase [Leptospira idonii]
MPKLSIITINFNDKVGLKRTIDSVKSQTWRDFEHIIIDGGSTDGSLELIQSESSHFSHWVSEKDKGIYNAQNKGILAAKGEYCQFLNSGDFLFDEKVLENIFSKNPNEDLLYGDMSIDYGNRIEYGKSPDRLTFPFLALEVLWHCTCFIKRELFSKYGTYDEAFRIVADVDFFFRALGMNDSSWRYFPLRIAQFNTGGFGSSPANQKLLADERERMLNKYLTPLQIEMCKTYLSLENECIRYRMSRVVRLSNLIKRIPVLSHSIQLLLFVMEKFYRLVRGYKLS